MKTNSLFLLVVVVFLGSACKKTSESSSSSPGISQTAVVETYANIAFATYQDSYTLAQAMKEKANVFLADPSESKFTDLKNAYLAARVPYEQSEAFRFYAGPIDGGDNLEAEINSWPLDEVFIDYVVDSTTSGIINNSGLYPNITADVLKGANGTDGSDANVSTGYHAIEFLLWGQDLSAQGPGDRPYTDYVVGEGGTHANQDRRIKYLTTVIDLLIADLEVVMDAWDPTGTNNYRTSFIADPTTSISNFITGAGRFAKGELAGQRMSVALATGEQEEEHSCFSDDTHHDIIYGNQSIANVYLGVYVRSNGTLVSGTSLSQLVAQNNASVDKQMLALITDAQNRTLLINPPFDQEILAGNAEGHTRVQNAITAIIAEGNQLVQVAAAIGIQLNIPDTNP